MKIKYNIKLFFCGLLSFILLLSGMNLNIHAQENTLSSNTTDITMEEGYITYYEPYRETLTGSGSWGFK